MRIGVSMLWPGDDQPKGRPRESLTYGRRRAERTSRYIVVQLPEETDISNAVGMRAPNVFDSGGSAHRLSPAL